STSGRSPCASTIDNASCAFRRAASGPAPPEIGLMMTVTDIYSDHESTKSTKTHEEFSVQDTLRDSSWLRVFVVPVAFTAARAAAGSGWRDPSARRRRR